MEITKKSMKWINHINPKIISNFKKLKKKLKNPKNNFVKKNLKTIGISVIWIFVGIIITSLFQNQISDFADEKIKGKSDYLSISLTHQLVFNNSELIDFNVFSDKNITLNHITINRNYSLYLNEGKNEYLLYEDGKKIITEGVHPLPFDFTNTNRTITPGCYFVFIKNFGLEPNEERSFNLLYEGIEDKDIFSVINSGNKKVASFKAGICLKDARILSTYGDINKEVSGCIEIRSTDLLPNDILRGSFLTDGKYEIYKVYGWDDRTEEYPPNRFVEIFSVFVPNCYASKT